MKIILSGGGTGGHIYPALTIADEIKKLHPEAEIIFVGTQQGLEKDIIPRYGYPLKFIEVAGFKRSLSFDTLRSFGKLFTGLSDAYGILKNEKPDLVITHWPIDSHRDHRVCAILVYDAWRQTGYNFDLYYGEVMTGLQTQTFAPDHWVNITEQHEQKVKAYYSHASQDMPVVQEWHDAMEIMRGMECHTQYGEAFVKQNY